MDFLITVCRHGPLALSTAEEDKMLVLVLGAQTPHCGPSPEHEQQDMAKPILPAQKALLAWWWAQEPSRVIVRNRVPLAEAFTTKRQAILVAP